MDVTDYKTKLNRKYRKEKNAVYKLFNKPCKWFFWYQL